MSSYRILGIDPGLNVTGYGCVEFDGQRPVIVEAGAIRTDASADMADRICQIHDDLSEIITELKPRCLAVEKLYAHYKHPRTSILMGHARGVILLAAARAELTIRHLPATEVKKSLTGNGHATKAQMQRAIQSACGLAEPPQPADVADALAIALCAARRI
jgi:crossover junction endodeoxyribonuclease RuvC